VDLALARAGRTPGDVDFLCVYQGTPWLRAVVQEYTGLQHARTHETFSTLGYLSAAMIPATLALASRAGSLRDGDLVVMTGGGTGMTYGATVMTWGRG
jgi:3-oxoacyl-[acyl-carrier-protein] synthase-3